MKLEDYVCRATFVCLLMASEFYGYTAILGKGEQKAKYLLEKVGNRQDFLWKKCKSAVAQELTAHRFPLYYLNSKKHGELDFVTEDRDGCILPIEVKSGKTYARHRALSNILDVPNYDLAEAYVLGPCNVKREGRILYAPIYMVSCFCNA